MGEIIFGNLCSIPCAMLRCWLAAVSLHKKSHTPMPTQNLSPRADSSPSSELGLKSNLISARKSHLWPHLRCCLASAADLHIEASLGGRAAVERHPASRTVLHILTNGATLDKRQHKKEK